jgi:hypothetical protein
MSRRSDYFAVGTGFLVVIGMIAYGPVVSISRINFAKL